MKKSTKIWLGVAGTLVVVGIMISIFTLSFNQWDFDRFSTRKFETNTYDVSQKFSNISMNTSVADIMFVLSENGKCKVECYEDEKAKHSVTVNDDTLYINVNEDKDWFDFININFQSPKITVYLPKSEYNMLSIDETTGDINISKDFKFKSVDVLLTTGNVNCLASASEMIKINATTGNIDVEDTSAARFDLSVTTGNIDVSNVVCKGDIEVNVTTGEADLTNVKCKNLVSDGSIGDMNLNSVIASQKLSVKRSTGEINFNGSDANEIFAQTSVGDIEGTLLTDKIFMAESDIGEVDVPKTTSGGRCEINTNTGDIDIEIK